MRFLVFLIFVLTITLNSDAQTIYKVVAADGSVTYTDQPIAGGEPVTLGKLNTADPLASPKPSQAIQTKPARQYTLSIISPRPEATIRNNLGDVSISASIQPLASGTYQLILDGKQVATNSSGAFQLSEVQRGAHTLKISFTDNTGKILASSDQQTFFMHKASALINSN